MAVQLPPDQLKNAASEEHELTEPPKLDTNQWIALAEVVSQRIATRKEVEWKLALEHYAALAACLYAGGTWLLPTLPNLKPYQNEAMIVVLVGSFLLSVKWIYLTETAHAYDGIMYRSYMDRAKGLRSKAVIAAEKLEQVTEPEPRCNLLCSPWKYFFETFGDEQTDWFWVHVGFSVLVHLVIALAFWMMITAKSPAELSL